MYAKLIKNEILQNSISNNSNISDADRALLSPCLNDIIEKLGKLNIEIPVENCASLFENLKISNNYEEDTTKFVSYDNAKNELKFCFAKADKNCLGDFYYQYIYSVLTIISKNYNEEYNKYVSGIEYIDENGIINGRTMNELLKKSIAVNIAQENPFDVPVMEFFYDSPFFYTMFDNLLEDVLYSKFGAEEVIECFVSGRGDIIASKLSDLLGIEDTKKLYSVVDQYSADPIYYRKIYDRLLTKLNLAYNEKNSLNKM